MTCIAAIKDHKGNIVMGGDSYAVRDYELHICSFPKVFYSGPFLIGIAGSYGCLQLIQISNIGEKLAKNHWNSFIKEPIKTMVQKFIPAIRKIIVNGHRLEDKANATMDCYMLVAFGPHLFEVTSCFSVQDSIYPYMSIGTGMDVALGVLCAENIEPLPLIEKDIITLALTAAERHITSVCAPFTILTTKEKNNE